MRRAAVRGVVLLSALVLALVPGALRRFRGRAAGPGEDPFGRQDRRAFNP